uniref:Type i inositol-trisphosphate 5-phosphatase 12-like n=1 Tax=Tetraselmis sp. GSL018 TaxID=582737 RepID=A0A061RQF4_9CHLO|eukprot:CAMPEP_0177625158 /NCGR_PEP_ID=MMETSP0419_2-20121207/29932_1 /TAXON_ID=582737 /ORGANISM="Tetraselmis sp., Strain GSL018" /LENGTH=1416 /DNA_ID=CAMNT_0019126049 /DNA_START=640 /DNA_END=4890 /DNA_ORIENTATION=-
MDTNFFSTDWSTQAPPGKASQVPGLSESSNWHLSREGAGGVSLNPQMAPQRHSPAVQSPADGSPLSPLSPAGAAPTAAAARPAAREAWARQRSASASPLGTPPAERADGPAVLAPVRRPPPPPSLSPGGSGNSSPLLAPRRPAPLPPTSISPQSRLGATCQPSPSSDPFADLLGPRSAPPTQNSSPLAWGGLPMKGKPSPPAGVSSTSSPGGIGSPQVEHRRATLQPDDLASGLEALYQSTSTRASANSSANGLSPPQRSPHSPHTPLPPMDVDGLPASAVDAWFKAADTDGDGKLTGSEAVAFFEMTGLSKSQLSLVWCHATGNKPCGLDRHMFSAALRLVALAQAGEAITHESAARVLHPPPGAPRLPPPRLDFGAASKAPEAAPIPAKPAARRSWESEQALPQPPAAASAPSDGLEGLERLIAGLPDVEPAPQAVTSDAFRCIPCLDVRLTPLNPKQADDLRVLCAAAGGLLAACTGHGSARIFQWGRAEGNIRAPDGSGEERVPQGQDPDMATAADLQDKSTGEVTCMLADELAQVVWTGHKDGYVVAWELGASGSAQMKRMHSWKAHRGSRIVAMCTTARGDLWTCSKYGSLRLWNQPRPGQLPNGSAGRELRREPGVRAHTDRPHGLAVSASGEIVWTIGSAKVHLWEASTGKFLGTLDSPTGIPPSSNTERIDTSQGLPVDAEGRVQTGGILRLGSVEEEVGFQVDKSLGAVRNVAGFMSMGGAKTLARSTEHAKKGAQMLSKFGSSLGKALGGGSGSAGAGSGSMGRRNVAAVDVHDFPDSFNTAGAASASSATSKESGARCACSVAAALDGSLWLGYRPPLVVTCLAAVGQCMWAGLSDGSIVVYHGTGSRVATWLAHRGAIVAMVVVGTRVFSMAANGTVTGWSAAIPGDGWSSLSSYWVRKLRQIVQRRTISVLAGTWNVNEQQPSQYSLNSWLGNRSKQAEIVVVGLQEIEMGTGSVAQAAVMDKLSLGEKGNVNAAWWRKSLAQTLGSLEPAGPAAWEMVSMRQLSGMMVIVFVRRELAPYIGEVSTDSIGCGVLGVGGNKGAVAVGFSVFRNYVAVVNSHFAAHQRDVDKRNENYGQILRGLCFTSWSSKVESEEPDDAEDEQEAEAVELPRTNRRMLSDSDSVIWLGDFNYRVDMDRDDVVAAVKDDNLTGPLAADQCRREMEAGRAFAGFQEAPINFQPTYKFDKGNTNPYAYDSSEKRRVPSWTDRIFFRGSAKRNLQSPTSVTMSSREYGACVEVIDSDHKPVYSVLMLDIPIADMAGKRRLASHVLKKAVADSGASTDATTPISLSRAHVLLSSKSKETVCLRNNSSVPMRFTVVGGSEGIAIPITVTVWPISGVIPPDSGVNISVSLTEFEDDSYIHASFSTTLILLSERELSPGSDERIKGSMPQKIQVEYSSRG